MKEEEEEEEEEDLNGKRRRRALKKEGVVEIIAFLPVSFKLIIPSWFFVCFITYALSILYLQLLRCLKFSRAKRKELRYEGRVLCLFAPPPSVTHTPTPPSSSPRFLSQPLLLLLLLLPPTSSPQWICFFVPSGQRPHLNLTSITPSSLAYCILHPLSFSLSNSDRTFCEDKSIYESAFLNAL